VSDLTQAEFDERVGILRRFRAALVRQRDRFRAYLRQLEERELSGDPDENLAFHVELEHAVVREISTFERSIEPLETLYRAHDPEGASEIPALREALQHTRDDVLRRTRENQKLLRSQIDDIRSTIRSLAAEHASASDDEYAVATEEGRARAALAGYSRKDGPELVNVTA
jgi:hypothetical protein